MRRNRGDSSGRRRHGGRASACECDAARVAVGLHAADRSSPSAAAVPSGSPDATGAARIGHARPSDRSAQSTCVGRSAGRLGIPDRRSISGNAWQHQRGRGPVLGGYRSGSLQVHQRTIRTPDGRPGAAQVSQRLAENTSDGIFAARLGGDEFGLLFTTSDPSIAEDRVEQLRVGCCAQVTPAITASSGVAFAEIRRDLKTSEVFRAADQALRQAKSDGRNRSVTAVVAASVAALGQNPGRL
jgi:hypothetical protein